MNILNALRVLGAWDRSGRYVFTKGDLRKLFSDDAPKAFDEGLRRLVGKGLLVRACRGVYVNERARSFDSFVLERIARALRRGEYSYVSLESMLSEYGVISQVPVDRLTIMTTGRKGVFKTPWGVLELTHTKRTPADILEHTISDRERPLRLATKQTAWEDLIRVGRNLEMVDRGELDAD